VKGSAHKPASSKPNCDALRQRGFLLRSGGSLLNKSLYAEAKRADELGGLNRSAELAEEASADHPALQERRIYRAGSGDAPDEFSLTNAAYQMVPCVIGGAGKFETLTGCDDSMKITMTTYMQTPKTSLVSVASDLARCSSHARLWQPGKEKEPVVTVQTSAEQLHFAVDSAEAGVFPVQQRHHAELLRPSHSSWCVGRVRQGQLLAILENKDLAAAAEQSKGECAAGRLRYYVVRGFRAGSESRTGHCRVKGGL